MSTVLASPAELIARGAPHVIHNDAELEAYTNALFQLTALESPSSSEVEAIELLTRRCRSKTSRSEVAERDGSRFVASLDRKRLGQTSGVERWDRTEAFSIRPYAPLAHPQA